MGWHRKDSGVGEVVGGGGVGDDDGEGADVVSEAVSSVEAVGKDGMDLSVVGPLVEVFVSVGRGLEVAL